jgi:hypothetical protein
MLTGCYFFEPRITRIARMNTIKYKLIAFGNEYRWPRIDTKEYKFAFGKY